MSKSRRKPSLVMVVDTREQRPYEFPADEVDTVRRALPAGDYSIAGFETTFAVERKSIDDLFSTVIGDRARFERELDKLRSYKLAVILVEATFREVLEYTSPASTGITDVQRAARPATVINSLNTYQVERGVRVLYVDRDRDLCRTLVLRLAQRFYREHAAQAREIGGAA